MCDEQYYFFGFESINKIYVDDYVYQDRPLYLLIGFIIHKILFLFNPILQIEKISLLLLTSLIIQILVVNLIAFFILLIAYKTSFSLRPFIDEIVSLSSSNNFFKSLIFQGPPSTPYGSAYSPNLTTGPIASVGSTFGLFFFERINEKAICNI